ILGQATAPEAAATIALGQPAAPAGNTVRTAPAPEPPPTPTPAALPAKSRTPIWIAAAAGVLLAAGGAVYGLMDQKKPARGRGAAAPQPPAGDKAAHDAQAAAEAQRLKDQEELAKLRAAAAAREKADQEAALRKQIEEETRRKLAAEAAERQRLRD